MAYGFMAAGIGVAVGWTIQYLGRGVTAKFSVLAAVLALAGCVLGNLLYVILAVARATGVSPVDVYASIDPGEMIGHLASDVGFVDWLFWIAAIGAAWYFAKRPLSREEFSAIRMYEDRVADSSAHR